jgi:hypothetical protein
VRLEQLVLFGPEDDFRVPFGPRVTVLAGMRPEDRAELVATLVQAMTGRLPGSSVIFSDHAGRRIFADRDGATFSDTGEPAPSLESLLGSDPEVVGRLMTLRAADLGLGSGATADAITVELDRERAHAAQIAEARNEGVATLIRIDEWRAEMAELDQLIETAEEDADRWAWIQLRNELDGVRAQLAAFDGDGDDPDDSRLLDAVDRLRDIGETWAEADTAVSELETRLVPLPDVSEADLERVARTPAELPAHFEDRASTWQAARAWRIERDAALVEATTLVSEDDDPLVVRLAPLDQQALWVAHHRLVVARQTYEAELIEMKGAVDPTVESEIESTHMEVVRCQRDVQRRFIPGALGSSILAVGALFAGDQLSLLVGVAMLVAAIAMGGWLLVTPRRALRLAQREEEMALAGADAASWLGLHLRRVDDLTERADRKRLDAATDAHATAQLDWEELTGFADPDLAFERREAIESRAAAMAPERRSEAERHARTDLGFAREDEAKARAALVEGLDAYGLLPSDLDELDADQLWVVLDRRIGAGRLARETQQLNDHKKRAAIAAADLDHLLGELGFDDGDLTSRLGRAIDAVSAARLRVHGPDGVKNRDQLEGEVVALSALVEAGRRPSWDASPDPAEPPVEPEVLVARRGELSRQIVDAGRPDVADLERRLSLVQERITETEARLQELSGGRRTMHQRIADRVNRTTWMGDYEDSLPILVDDPFGELPEDERRAVLDLLTRLSSRAQVIILTLDPVVARWARANAHTGDITLLEADHATV